MPFRLRAEIDSVLGSRSEIKFEDLSELKYTGCVFKETLRMYPPASGFSRITSKDIVTDDFVIPKGTSISVNY